jgi:hypothetical protein
MINIFEKLDNLSIALSSAKHEMLVDKYCVTLNQRNEFDIVIVADEINIDDLFTNVDLEHTNIVVLSNEELEEDYFYQEKFLNAGDEIIDYKNSRRKLTNLLEPENEFMPEIPVITFYSYKGGMGRSTNLVVTATHLARHYGRKIVIIDCDFEAPGFSNFFSEEPSIPRYSNGLMEYFNDRDHMEKINLNDYSWEVSKDYSKDGEIRVIPAGNLDYRSELNNKLLPSHLSHYLEGLARLDTSSTESIIEKFKLLIEDIRSQYSPDAIFIDSRTGFTDIFGITALKLSSQMIGFFSNSVQNEPGLYQFVTSIGNLIDFKKDLTPPIIVNSFSDSDFFQQFSNKVDEMINYNNTTNDSFQLSPSYFYFRNNQTLAELGTKREKKNDWIEQIDEKAFGKGYVDVAEKINEFLFRETITIEEKGVSSKNVDGSDNHINTNTEPCLNLVEKESHSPKNSFIILQERILRALKKEWPSLYGDSETADYQKEYDEKRFFFRDSMKDIFNLNKFIVLGNKGTGKSYLFQALRNVDITDELKKRAQKANSNIKFLHLVDKSSNYFISTKGLESFQKQIESIGDFYSKFWKVYTWKSILENLNFAQDFTSTIEVNFTIKNDDTGNLKNLVAFISEIDNIIAVEKELENLDSFLNSREIDLIGIYDNLDLMVEPYLWKDQMASLINFWAFSKYRRIHSKLFLRSDLYTTIRGINNVQSLNNSIISIEWQKEELFNYFFNLVKQYANKDFVEAVTLYNFKKASDDALEWLEDFKKKFSNDKQYQFDSLILRKLCWVFFGQYPNVIKAHGESYDWLYKNLMNADETISLRPFLDLLDLSISKYENDNEEEKDLSAILAAKYYTAKSVRSKAVENHFTDLITEKGNENLKHVFDFIDKNEDYQFYQLTRSEFYEMLAKVIKQKNLDCTVEELEKNLKITGIVKQVGNFQYSFAFLYKYRLGLRNRKNRRFNKKY